jgi:hypothetical protein
MGVPHELEFLTEGGLYSLDIALKGRKICIEADGPTHYSINRPTVRIGGDNLREAILTKQGWTVIQIPWFTWQAAPERDRREYIANLLYEHAGLTMKQLTAGAREQASLRDLGADVFMSEPNTPDTKPSSTEPRYLNDRPSLLCQYSLSQVIATDPNSWTVYRVMGRSIGFDTNFTTFQRNI